MRARHRAAAPTRSARTSTPTTCRPSAASTPFTGLARRPRPHYHQRGHRADRLGHEQLSACSPPSAPAAPSAISLSTISTSPPTRTSRRPDNSSASRGLKRRHDRQRHVNGRAPLDGSSLPINLAGVIAGGLVGQRSYTRRPRARSAFERHQRDCDSRRRLHRRVLADSTSRAASSGRTRGLQHHRLARDRHGHRR